ncbi:serine/threonine-protein kinase, partial [Haliangium sp. UPWRP_2]|uniref:serine/threonine-protein kinase n=1 Tax=Haliangium sp. UPWRP_2 TaxID=1931276 RepID=UPI000D0DEE30
LLKPEISRVPEFAARFEREAMAAANIEHPNVAAATDCGQTEDGTFFLALEYVVGQSLRQALQEGPLPVQRALHIAQQVGSALVRAHELGIVHRDLKPENIMLTRRDGDPDFAKVLDFGLAKLSAGGAAGGQSTTVQKLTQFGEIFGTPQYMAPEQTTGGETDARTDLYALGLILYEMLTGRMPFDGQNISDFLRHQLATELPPIRQRAPQVAVPDWAEALVRRLCEKQPEDRFQSAEQFVDALESAAQAHSMVLVPPRARGSSPSIRDSRSGVAAAGAQPVQAAPPSLAPAAAPLPPALAVAPTPPAPAAARAPVGIPQTASMVMFMAAVGRAQKRLPQPLQKVSPEKLTLLAVVLGLGLFSSLLLLSWTVRTSDNDSGRSAAPKKAKAPVATGPTAEEVKTATAGGIPSLLQLMQRYPAAKEPLRPLALAYIQQGQTEVALTTLGQLAKKSPQSMDDPELVQFISSQVMSSRQDVSSAALHALERDFGDRGADLLIKFADSVPQRSRGRFNQSLTNMRSRTDLSAATQALLELRLAAKCEQKRVALLRVRQSGDARSLPLLYALQTPNGCAPFGLGDCWGCLRQSTDLQDTITAVTGRTGASAAAPAPESGEEEPSDE